VTTGLKANSDGSAAIQVGGVDAITLTSAGAATFLTSPTTVQAGTAAAPSITFSGDTNTGIYSPGADQVAIATGGTERVRVNSSGNTQTVGTISVGNATPSTSGAGITFPATQSASSDANTLDDYEEGSWTPTWTRSSTNPTFTVQSGNTGGRYTKIGNLVTVSFEFRTNAISNGGSGNWQISGLPFAANSSVPRYFGAMGRFFNNADISGLRFESNVNSTVLLFVTISTDSGYDAAAGGSIVIMQGTISYMV
jgi:hypothetical protein